MKKVWGIIMVAAFFFGFAGVSLAETFNWMGHSDQLEQVYVCSEADSECSVYGIVPVEGFDPKIGIPRVFVIKQYDEAPNWAMEGAWSSQSFQLVPGVVMVYLGYTDGEEGENVFHGTVKVSMDYKELIPKPLLRR